MPGLAVSNNLASCHPRPLLFPAPTLVLGRDNMARSGVPVSWVARLCSKVSPYHSRKRSTYSTPFLDSTLNMKSQRTNKTSITVYHSTKHNIPEDLVLQFEAVEEIHDKAAVHKSQAPGCRGLQHFVPWCKILWGRQGGTCCISQYRGSAFWGPVTFLLPPCSSMHVLM